LSGVIAALTRHNHIQSFQDVDIKSILQWRNALFAYVRGRLPSLGSGKKHRINVGKIVFFTHALHEDCAYHATPTYKSNSLHVRPLNLTLCPPITVIAGRDRMDDPAAAASRRCRVSNQNWLRVRSERLHPSRGSKPSGCRQT